MLDPELTRCRVALLGADNPHLLPVPRVPRVPRSRPQSARADHNRPSTTTPANAAVLKVRIAVPTGLILRTDMVLTADSGTVGRVSAASAPRPRGAPYRVSPTSSGRFSTTRVPSSRVTRTFDGRLPSTSCGVASWTRQRVHAL